VREVRIGFLRGSKRGLFGRAEVMNGVRE